DLDALRLRHEFLEMPGLTISVPQAARMLGLRSQHAAAILDTLAREKFLTRTPGGPDPRAFASQLMEHSTRSARGHFRDPPHMSRSFSVSLGKVSRPKGVVSALRAGIGSGTSAPLMLCHRMRFSASSSARS